MSRRYFRTLSAAAAATALGLTLMSAPLATARGERGPGPANDRAAVQAERALAKAEALFEAAPGQRKGSREATLVLRDLVAARADLSRSDRAVADRILARPTSPGDVDYYGAGATAKRACATNVCVHWAASGPEASTRAYATEVLTTMNGVHQTYVQAGYRAPKSDKGRGGNNKPDVYLAQIADQDLYGYCTTDQKQFVSPSNRSVWAYCVLDNDYAQSEYPSNTPLENMQVTAAHEYMHAVQFAYDYYEDGWIMEATATWVEDELFDGVDDNVSYLDSGQLVDPSVPLDMFDPNLQNYYGNWIWFRYLTEKYQSFSGELPTLPRNVWRQLDSTNGARRDKYSLQGLQKVLASKGSSLEQEYAAFSAENTTPQLTYDEGVENAYPSPALAVGPIAVTPAAPTHSRTVTLDHMTSGTGAFEPAASMGATWQLEVDVDLAPTAAGSRAVVTVVGTDGSVNRTPVPIGTNGDGSTVVPFAHADVESVLVTLVNASDRMRDCYTDPYWTFACAGFGRDDNLNQRVTVTAFE